MHTVLNAANFAAQKHAGQRRKNAAQDPYINHPIEVAKIIASSGITDTDVLCAALLHDTVEDTDTSLSEIEYTFGKTIASYVAEVSDDKSLPKVERKKLQILHARDATPGAKLVKLADKISNLSSLLTDPPVDWSRDRIIGYVRWSYRVTNEMKGVSHVLDAMLQSIYHNFNIVDVTDGELTQYYAGL